MITKSNFVLLSIFIIGGVILLNTSTNTVHLCQVYFTFSHVTWKRGHTYKIFIWWNKITGNTVHMLIALVNNTEENIDMNIEENEKLEWTKSLKNIPLFTIRKLKCIEKIVGTYQACL